MSPSQVITQWLNAFNSADVETLASLYHENAINHQMPNTPVIGKESIRQMFTSEFRSAPEMHCIPIQVIAEGEWAVLEWKDPKGFHGCGFFHVQNDLIVTQRGYWDKVTFTSLYMTD